MRCNWSMCHIFPLLIYSHERPLSFNAVAQWQAGGIQRSEGCRWPELGNCSGIGGKGFKLEWVLEAGATLIEKQKWWREGADFLRGSIDKEDTDKKSGETQASIRGVCVWAARRDTQVSNGVRKELVCSVMSWMSVIFCGGKSSLAVAWEASSTSPWALPLFHQSLMVLHALWQAQGYISDTVNSFKASL